MTSKSDTLREETRTEEGVQTEQPVNQVEAVNENDSKTADKGKKGKKNAGKQDAKVKEEKVSSTIESDQPQQSIEAQGGNANDSDSESESLEDWPDKEVEPTSTHTSVKPATSQPEPLIENEAGRGLVSEPVTTEPSKEVDLFPQSNEPELFPSTETPDLFPSSIEQGSIDLFSPTPTTSKPDEDAEAEEFDQIMEREAEIKVAQIWEEQVEKDGLVLEVDAVGSADEATGTSPVELAKEVSPPIETAETPEKDGMFGAALQDSDDLFGASAAIATEDLFGSSSHSPTEAQAEEEPQADLFGSDPVHDGADDLFGSINENESFLASVETYEAEAPRETVQDQDESSGLFETQEVSDDPFAAIAGSSSNKVEENDEAREFTASQPSHVDVTETTSAEQDLFGAGRSQGVDDIFGQTDESNGFDLVTSAEGTTDATDLFKHDTLQDEEDLFANLGASAREEDDGFKPQEAMQPEEEENDPFDLNETAGEDWLGVDAVEPVPTDTVPATEDDPLAIDPADLDLMGVPEGWLDTNGDWNWYTEDERMDVAKEMVRNEKAETPVQEAPSTDPYAPPAQAYTAPPVQPYNPYVPSPTSYQQSAQASNSSASYNPAYNTYAPPPVQPYVPSNYSPAPSPYTPSPYAPPNTVPSSSYSQSRGSSAVPRHVAPPATALNRSTTPTAYDPPVMPSRNLTRTPSAAPVITNYASMPYGQSYNATPVSSPPPAPSGPPRSVIPPKSASSIASTLTGRATPTAYDPPVPAMSRQPSYAKLKPMPEAPPPLPQIAPPMPPTPAAPPPPPPGPPKGPSRSTSVVNSLPPSNTYRPPSRGPSYLPPPSGVKSSTLPVPPIPNHLIGSAANTSPFGSQRATSPLPYANARQPGESQIADAPHSQPSTPSVTKTTLPAQMPSSPYAPSIPLPFVNTPALATLAGSSPPRNEMPSSGLHTVGKIQAPPTNISPARNRPSLREDTFQPPVQKSATDALGSQVVMPGPSESSLDNGPVQEHLNPYAPVSQPMGQSMYEPEHKAPPVAYNPYQSAPSESYNPSAYITPTPNVYAFQNEPQEAATPAPEYFPSIGSTYEPAPETIPASLEEDVLGRASESSKRVPCVSFGPHGQLVIVHQVEAEQESDGQRLLPAYGDSSNSQKVQLHRLNEVVPTVTATSGSLDWPGPLYIDSSTSKVSAAAKKKRDAVHAYLDARIQEIETGLAYISASSDNGQIDRYRSEAHLVILQLTKQMLLADGKVLSSDIGSKPDVIATLSGHSAEMDMDPALRKTTDTTGPTASSADLKYLAHMLVRGQQQQAQQYAIQHRLWSHALLISSVMGPQAWQGCVEAFIGQSSVDIKTELQQPLVTAYNLYAGSSRLAPVADKIGDWRDSLATVFANAKPTDQDSLLLLADQFKQIGLVEAAHICYLLSPKLSEWISGINTSRVSLFGCSDIGAASRDLEFSELIEYALSFKTVPKGVEPFHGVIHLLPYKLQKAWEYFSSGQIIEAQSYCNAVLTLARQTKASTSVLAAVTREAEILSARIAGLTVATPTSKRGSKPNLENIGSWFEGRLTKFIAGDEEGGSSADQQSKTKASSEKAAVGPFSHYSAISSPNVAPKLARAASTYELPSQRATMSGPNAYRSGSAASYRPRQPSHLGMTRPTSAMSQRSTTDYQAQPELSMISSYSGDYDHDEREPELTEPAVPIAQAITSDVRDYKQPSTSDDAPENAIQLPTWGQSYEDPAQEGLNETEPLEPSGEGFINPMQGFLAPAASIPSYAPTTNTSFNAQRNFEDEDDDDLGLGNSSSKKRANSEQPEPSAKPTESPQSASAYEPAVDKEEPKKDETKKDVPDVNKGSQSGSRWLGKWWGGKKEEPAAGPGPVKAKLGEESAFYYDKEQKRWINKSAGATEPPKPSAPPPPTSRGPSTSVSAIPRATPPITGGAPPPASRPPSNLSGAGPSKLPTTAAPPPGGPPSRAATSLTTGPPRPSASSTDPPLADPLAAPPARRAPAKGRTKYVNIM